MVESSELKDEANEFFLTNSTDFQNTVGTELPDT